MEVRQIVMNAFFDPAGEKTAFFTSGLIAAGLKNTIKKLYYFLGLFN